MNTFTNFPGLRNLVATSAGLTIGACSYVVLQSLSTYGLVATILCVICTTLTVRHALGDPARYGQRLALGTLLPPVLVFLPLLWGAAIAFGAGLLAFMALLGLCHLLFVATREPEHAQRNSLLVLAGWTAAMAGFALALGQAQSPSGLMAAFVGALALVALVLALALPRPFPRAPIQN